MKMIFQLVMTLVLKFEYGVSSSIEDLFGILVGIEDVKSVGVGGSICDKFGLPLIMKVVLDLVFELVLDLINELVLKFMM